MSKPIVLVTGCTEGGIGYSVAKRFAQEGSQVIATGRRVEALGDLEKFGCDREKLDICDHQSIESVVNKIIEKYGRIDVLVNNAGAPAIGALLDVSLETIHQCINTNVIGTLFMCRAVAVHMAKKKSGKIVNIGSVVGYATTPWAGIYALSKAATHSLSDTLRLELRPFGIQVTVVAPGAIRSNFGTNSAKTSLVPEGSLYTRVASNIINRGSMSQGPHSTPSEVFAAHVVKKVNRDTAPRYITYGAMSWIFVLFYYLPYFLRDMIFYKKFGVNLLE
ncbi:hypothetical protein G6F56_005114 [Rhizopus delemar]|uniref:NADPH-dependent 1-acyldihydroxyacetone phosphate reductase n=1 Tax=Rhizopus stolonifer TaxID=4846 RepID=A0A367J8H4_RHIST|nr:hypothetical protein G6F56_005114 [Rhizopus delemar]RCH86237.1 hypothetical protein CU098_007301 [Rhizopus stolonifer]